MAGQSADAFWRQTPRTTIAILTACNKRAEQAHDLAITQAWLTAALYRSKKLPDLKKLIGRNTPPKRQTPEELLANLRRLKSIFGGKDGRS